MPASASLILLLLLLLGIIDGTKHGLPGSHSGSKSSLSGPFSRSLHNHKAPLCLSFPLSAAFHSTNALLLTMSGRRAACLTCNIPSNHNDHWTMSDAPVSPLPSPAISSLPRASIGSSNASEPHSASTSTDLVVSPAATHPTEHVLQLPSTASSFSHISDASINPCICHKIPRPRNGEILTSMTLESSTLM